MEGKLGGSALRGSFQVLGVKRRPEARVTRFCDLGESAGQEAGTVRLLIARVNYGTQKIFIRVILTHAEYDRGRWKK